MSNSFRALLGGLIMLAFAVILVVSYGGELTRDFGLSRENLVPHPTARVVKAKCDVWYLLVSACTVEYDDPATTKPADKIQVKPELSYLMLGSVGGERVMLMRPANGGQVVTSNTGIDHLTNRMMTLLILAGFCVIVPIWVAIKVLSGGSEPAAASDRSLTSDSVDAAIAKRQLAQDAPAFAPPAYRPATEARPSFGQRRLSR
jgi:hypothetical protein